MHPSVAPTTDSWRAAFALRRRVSFREQLLGGEPLLSGLLAGMGQSRVANQSHQPRRGGFHARRQRHALDMPRGVSAAEELRFGLPPGALFMSSISICIFLPARANNNALASINAQ